MNVTVAATQMACGWDRDENIARAERLVREAAGRGANVVLIQELFETPYFCIDQQNRHFDLAHSIGNSDLHLHNWAPDFAVWCSYKYLNGGPGAIGGAFVHSRHHKPDVRPRLAGWWGHDVKRRFALEHEFAATPGAFR